MAGREKNRSILIVEDELVLRGLLVTTLRADGFTVYEAENGKEGLEEAFKRHPQLILLDIIMPEMNGMEMLKYIREDKWGQSASVVLLTNLGDTESIEGAKAFGVHEYLVKSDWSLDELSLRIKELLDGTDKATV